jgi:hypothetical protein
MCDYELRINFNINFDESALPVLINLVRQGSAVESALYREPLIEIAHAHPRMNGLNIYERVLDPLIMLCCVFHIAKVRLLS